jgi:hypothetical protein
MSYDDEIGGNFLMEGERELWRGKQWLLTTLHLEEIAGRNNLLGPPYWIELGPASLRDREYLRGIMDKVWVDEVDFLEAYRRGCEWLGIEPVDFSTEVRKSALDAMIDDVIASGGQKPSCEIVNLATERRRRGGGGWKSIGSIVRTARPPDGAA